MNIGSYDNPVYAIPEVKTAMQAAVDKVNAGGGIGGHPLRAVYCDDQLSPNGATACAQQAQSEKVAAVVGAVEVIGDALPVLEKAGIPYIGGAGISPQELTSSISFPLASGTPGWYRGIATAAVSAGKTKIAVIHADNASAEGSAQYAVKAIEDAGLKPVRNIVAPAGQADYSAQAAAASEGGVDAILLVVTPEQSTPIIRALRQGGYTGLVSALASNFAPDQIKALGTDAEGGLSVSQVTSVSDTSNPVEAEFTAAMKAKDPKAVVDEVGLITWTAVDLFQKVASTLQTVDAASVLSGFENLNTPIDLGSTGPYKVLGTNPPSEFPRIFNPTVTVAKVSDGSLVGAGGFIDPFAKP